MLPIATIYFLWLLNNPKQHLIGLSLCLIFLCISIVFSQELKDISALVGKVLICFLVYSATSIYIKDVDRLKNVIYMVFSFLLFEALLRSMCMTPSLPLLLAGPLSYKTECSPFFFDSNTSGNIVALLYAILLYTAKSHKKIVIISMALVLVVLSLLTASKASFITCICISLLYIFEKIVRSDGIRFAIIFSVVVIVGGIVIGLLSFDPSFASKLDFVTHLFQSLLDRPQDYIFGHGYYTGAKALAGKLEFAHINPALVIGTCGLLGAILYYGFIVKSMFYSASSFMMLSAFLLLSLSYLPPFFDYYFVLIAMAERAIKLNRESLRIVS
ncbi:hypothetical protein [Ferrimonas futtsuensis]|uniref:hypothetical protein n=1 Tax=Ferrimonas futtsuensis TaxID=364764 RepID=UPI0012FBCFC8|nr:hypothetical protein [Ferrimonas futtsuensis]